MGKAFFLFPVIFKFIRSFPGTSDPERGHASEVASYPAIVQLGFF